MEVRDGAEAVSLSYYSEGTGAGHEYELVDTLRVSGSLRGGVLVPGGTHTLYVRLRGVEKLRTFSLQGAAEGEFAIDRVTPGSHSVVFAVDVAGSEPIEIGTTVDIAGVTVMDTVDLR